MFKKISDIPKASSSLDEAKKNIKELPKEEIKNLSDIEIKELGKEYKDKESLSDKANTLPKLSDIETEKLNQQN